MPKNLNPLNIPTAGRIMPWDPGTHTGDNSLPLVDPNASPEMKSRIVEGTRLIDDALVKTVTAIPGPQPATRPQPAATAKIGRFKPVLIRR